MFERLVKISNSEFTEVVCLDEPGVGMACHEYLVRKLNLDEKPSMPFVRISFQNGPIQETGVNGCQQEDLLAIVIDRLRSFQSGPFDCRENDLALAKCEEALFWLNRRTADRQSRGVEGLSIN